jgi:hypothetical protein
MITAEEIQKYGAFIEEQMKFLKVLEVNNQDIIWHYTSNDALLGVVETGTLYATQVSCLNDSTEVRYGAKLLRDAFMNIQTDAMEERVLLERIIKATVEEPATPTNLPSAWFVTCFSKEKDDLSQWRAYSGGENGYAIAFLAGAFFNRGSIVARVNYDEEQHKQVAENVANATISFFKEGLYARPTGEINTATVDAWATEFLGVGRDWLAASPLWSRTQPSGVRTNTASSMNFRYMRWGNCGLGKSKPLCPGICP